MPNGSRRQRVERLVSAWNQGSDGVPPSVDEPDDPLVEAAAEPRRRARTQLSDEDADAMRTARASGVSITALTKKLDVHRGTVWAKTREHGEGLRAISRTHGEYSGNVGVRLDPGTQLRVNPPDQGNQVIPPGIKVE